MSFSSNTQARTRCRSELLLQGQDLTVTLFDFVEQLADPIAHFERTRSQRFGSGEEFSFPAAQVLFGGFGGERFDPTDALGDAGFGRDFQQADVTAAAYVRTTAQLDGLANLQNADAVAVPFRQTAPWHRAFAHRQSRIHR